MHKPGKNASYTLLGHSAYIFLIRFCPTLASVAALVLLSRYTAPAFYGRYQSFWVQWQVLSTVACLGLPTLLLTYPAAQVNAMLRALRPSYVRLLVPWLVLVAAAFAGLQAATNSVFAPVLAALFLFVGAFIAVLESYLILGRQFEKVALVNTGYAALFMVAHWLFIREQLSANKLMGALLLGSSMRLCYLGYLAHRQYVAAASLAAPVVEWSPIRSLWLHTGLYDLTQMLFRWVDKFVLNFLLPAHLFAIYFNGTIDVPFLSLLLGAAGSALLLQFSHTDANDEERIHLLRQSAGLLARVVFPLFFFLLFFRYELFAILFSHKYDAAVPLFLCSLLVVPLRAYNFTSLLQSKGQGRTINVGAVLDLLLALLLMYPLYLGFGLVGVVAAFVVSTYCQAFYYLWHTSKLLQVTWLALLPLKGWLVQAGTFGAFFFVLHYVLAQHLAALFVLLVGIGFLCVLIGGLLLATSFERQKAVAG